MADKKAPKTTRKLQSVRERAANSEVEKKPRRLRVASTAMKKPISGAAQAGRKEYHPIKLPDNRVGRILGRRVHFIPRYFRDAWTELKQVTWPSRRESVKLTVAVFIFAVLFGALIWVTDYGLEQLFRKVLID